MDQSLVFTVISLSEFFGQHFSTTHWYPYWYLGGPFYYLIGPIVPSLIILLSQLLSVSFYQSYIILIILSLVFGSIGLYLFLRAWKVSKLQSFITSFFLLVLPWNLLLLQSQNGLKHVSLAFLPFLFLVILSFLRRQKRKDGFLVIILLTFILLTNAFSFLAVIIGLIAIFVAETRHNNHYSSQSKEILVGKLVVLIIASLSFATIWYTPTYWWLILANPSIGGIPLFRFIWNVLNSLISVVPIMLALLFVKWRHVHIKGYALFCVLYIVTFIVLTIFRFVADPDFVMDWLGFGLELQIGFALFLGFIVCRLMMRGKVFVFASIVLCCCLTIFWPVMLRDVLMYSNNSYKADIIELIEPQKIARERLFSSGSPVFWINNSKAISQVRGGNDVASINPVWAHGAYQIREGDEKVLSDYWLQVFGVSYILVHDKSSQEPFHDFKHPEKFEQYKKITTKSGNTLYGISHSFIARIADKSLLQLSRPKGGADEQALSRYVSLLKNEVTLIWHNPTTIELSANLKKDEVISIAETYENGWKITKNDGIITSDSFGNMVVIPGKSGSQTFVLTYHKNFFGQTLPLFVGLISLILFLKFDLFAPIIKKRLPKLSIGLHDDDKDY